MAFRVITKDDAGELTREFRSITGAKRNVADTLMGRAAELLADDSLWAGRTQTLMRERVTLHIAGARQALEYDVESVEVEGVTYRIEHDAEAPTRTQTKAANKVVKEARWMGAKFTAKCGTCRNEIAQGEQQFYVYEERKPYCSNGCGQAREGALKTNALIGAKP